MTIKCKKDLVEKYEFSVFALRKYLNNGELYKKLQNAGYYKYNKQLTPLQIDIIISFLGDPT